MGTPLWERVRLHLDILRCIWIVHVGVRILLCIALKGQRLRYEVSTQSSHKTQSFACSLIKYPPWSSYTSILQQQGQARVRLRNYSRASWQINVCESQVCALLAFYPKC